MAEDCRKYIAQRILYLKNGLRETEEKTSSATEEEIEDANTTSTGFTTRLSVPSLQHGLQLLAFLGKRGNRIIHDDDLFLQIENLVLSRGETRQQCKGKQTEFGRELKQALSKII